MGLISEGGGKSIALYFPYCNTFSGNRSRRLGAPAAFAEKTRYSSRIDTLKMLAEMRQERAQIEEAILVLERLASGHGRRRGRPPAWMTAAANALKKPGRPPGSKNKTAPQERCRGALSASWTRLTVASKATEEYIGKGADDSRPRHAFSLREQLNDLFLVVFPANDTHVLGGDPALTIDQEGGRKRGDSIPFGQVFMTDHQRIEDFTRIHGEGRDRPDISQGDSDDCEPLAYVSLLKL
jgi:hypothetical protein